MKYSGRTKFEESSKDRFIKNNPNLTEEQKTEIIAFFDKYNDVRGQIKDWYKAQNEFTYEDFYNIMKPYLDKEAEKEKNKKRKEIINNNLQKIKSSYKLSREEKKALELLFLKAPHVADDIDWENVDALSYDDFIKYFTPYQKDYIMKKGTFKDLVEGEDYILLGKDDMYNYFYILTHKASRILASNSVAPKLWWKFKTREGSPMGNHGWYEKHNLIFDYPYEPNLAKGGKEYGYGGASWCIAMPHSDHLWRAYLINYDSDTNKRYIFAIANRPKVAEKKVAIVVDKNYGNIDEVVSGVSDSAVTDEIGTLIGLTSEQKKEHVACDKKIRDFLKNNETFKKLFVTHEMTDPMEIKEGNVYVNGKLVSKKSEKKTRESLEVDITFERLREARLEESSKDKYIKNNPNLTEEQKTEIIAFFDKYNDVQGQIKDWKNKAQNEFTYEDFYNIMKPYLEKAKLKDKKALISEYLKKADAENYFLTTKIAYPYASYSRVKDPNATEGSNKTVNPFVWNLRLFFRKAPQAYNDINYDNLDNMTWKDWENIFIPYQDLLVKKGTMSDLVEGVDYEFIGSSEHYNCYYIKTYKASWIMASNAIPPRVYFKDLKGWYKNYNWLLDYPKAHIEMKSNGAGDFYSGASWCLAMPHSSEYWTTYRNYKVVFAIGKMKGLPEKKLAVLCYQDGSVQSVTDAVKDQPCIIDEYNRNGTNACAVEVRRFLNANKDWAKK